MKEKIEKLIKFSMKIFWIFVIGSIFGFFAEMLYTLVYTRTLEIRQGLIYGPFVQVYGMGAMAYYLLVSKIQEPKKLFFSGMIMGGVLEYLCSFFQEIFWGTVSWEYSHLFMNFNGRTSLLYCFYWGIIAVAYLKIFYPLFQKLDSFIEKKGIKIFTVFFMLFMVFDITISCMAADRQQKRREHLPPANAIEVFLDEHYPDELMNRVYNNKKEMDV